MKKIHTAILLISIHITAFSQTFIPMPDGYGDSGGSGEVQFPNGSVPFYADENFVYCFTDENGTSTNRYIAKLNTSTNQITICSNSFDKNLGIPKSPKEHNGNIYFWLNNAIYRLNNAANELVIVANDAEVLLSGYSFQNNEMYFNTESSFDFKILNLDSGTINENITIDNRFIRYIISSYKYQNIVYNICATDNGDDTGNITYCLIKVDTNNTQTIVWEHPSEYFKMVGVLNNKMILSIFENNALKLVSYDVSDASLDTNYYLYNNSFNAQNPFIFNGNLYITDGNLVYKKNGETNLLSATAITPFNYSFRQLKFDNNYYDNDNLNYTLLNNNKIVGAIDNSLVLIDMNENSTLIYSDYCNRGLSYNDKLYFESNGNIFQSDGTVNSTFSISSEDFNISFDDLFISNNKLYFQGYNYNLDINHGLYMIDLNLLNTTNFTPKFKLTLYPNPAFSILQVQTNETIQSIKINDVSGRTTIINDFTNNKIDVSHLSNGLYFVEITCADAIYKEKFIKN